MEWSEDCVTSGAEHESKESKGNFNPPCLLSVQFFEKYAAVYGAFVLRSLLFLKFLVFF